VPRKRRTESVFLNIPYDASFENLYLAYIVGLTQLGFRINVAVAVPNQDRLQTIIELIEKSNLSIHDLSRVELVRGVPRFNMPVELGIALYRSQITRGKHKVCFERYLACRIRQVKRLGTRGVSEEGGFRERHQRSRLYTFRAEMPRPLGTQGGGV
jgi:hypothetical protein